MMQYSEHSFEADPSMESGLEVCQGKEENGDSNEPVTEEESRVDSVQVQQISGGLVSDPRRVHNYTVVNAILEKKEDGPGPRCGHTLTAVAASGEEGTRGYVGPRLILFGGANALWRFVGYGTADVHCYDVLTNKWSRLTPYGEPPTPRQAHVATAMGTTVVIHGGIGPDGLIAEDLYVLDLTQQRARWHRMVVQGPGPGKRYGHVMAIAGQRYIIVIGGNDGDHRLLDDIWALDTTEKTYKWQKLEPEGDCPPPCMYATLTAHLDGLLLFCGGKDANSMPLASAYGLLKHKDGPWEWAIVPNVSLSPRYHHAAVFVNSRLYVSGGTLGGGRMVEDSSSVAGIIS